MPLAAFWFLDAVAAAAVGYYVSKYLAKREAGEKAKNRK
jgi:hypothetical protein